MKKIVTFFIVIVMSLTLFACSNQGQIKEGSFLFELINFEKEKLISKEIKYDDNNLISSIEKEIELDYEVYNFGFFIKGVGNNYPKEYNKTFNYYYQIEVNDEKITTSLDKVKFEKNLKVTIKEVTSLDEKNLKVDQIIYELVKEIDTNKEINYMLFASLVHANNYGYNLIDLSSYSHDLDFTSVNSSLKSLIYNQAMKKTISKDQIEQILNLEVGKWDKQNYLSILNVLGGEEERILNIAYEYINEDLDNDNQELSTMDSDGLSTILVNYSSVRAEVKINQYIDKILTSLESQVLDDGMNGFNGPNLSSTALTLIGLNAIGLGSKTLPNIDLVETILKYYTKGGFKANLDGELDLSFATPQGLASLIIYKIQRDQLSSSEDKDLNIFSFKYES